MSGDAQTMPACPDCGAPTRPSDRFPAHVIACTSRDCGHFFSRGTLNALPAPGAAPPPPAAPAEDCMACADLGYICHWCTVKRSEARKIAAPAARAEGEDVPMRELYALACAERERLATTLAETALARDAAESAREAAVRERVAFACDLRRINDALDAAGMSNDADDVVRVQRLAYERDVWKAKPIPTRVAEERDRAERAEAALRSVCAAGDALARACLPWIDDGSAPALADARVAWVSARRAALAPAPGEAETGEVDRDA